MTNIKFMFIFYLQSNKSAWEEWGERLTTWSVVWTPAWTLYSSNSLLISLSIPWKQNRSAQTLHWLTWLTSGDIYLIFFICKLWPCFQITSGRCCVRAFFWFLHKHRLVLHGDPLLINTNHFSHCSCLTHGQEKGLCMWKKRPSLYTEKNNIVAK